MAGKKQYELLFQLTARLGPNFSQSFKNASQTMKTLQNDLKSARQKLKDVSAYQKQQAAVANSKSRVTELQKEYDKLVSETGDVENATDKQKKALDKASGALEKAKKAAADEQNTLVEMSDSLRDAGINTSNLGRDTNELRQQYERLEQAQRKAQEITEKQDANKQAISQTKAQLGGLVGTVTAVGAAIYAGPVKKAAEFREQMSTVSAISGATGTELQMLSEKAKEMGAKTKFTAKEAGEAMEYMAMAGWKSKDMLGGIEGIMDLAAASGEELGSVSDIVTDALTAFGLTASDAEHFADVLAQASSNANTNVGMMGETFKYVAPVAGALGYTAEDTANLIGLMANSGIKASQAGTSLRKIFLGLQGGVELTGDKLGKYHLEVENADGSMRKLEDVTKDLREAFGQMTEAEKAANAEKIAGKTGMSGLLAIVNASEKDYQKLTKSIEECDGAAKRMAETKLDNLNGSITLAQSAFDALQVELGELLLPTLTEGVKKFTDITSAVTTFVRENPEAVKAVAKIVTGLVGLKAGGLVAKLGFLEVKGGILSIQKAFTMIKGLGITKYISSMGGGLAGAVKRILSYFKGIGSAAGGVASAFGNIFANSSVFSKLGGAMKNAGLKMMGFMLKPFSMFGAKLSGALANVAGVIARSPIGTIGVVIGKGFSKITAFIAPIGNAIKTVLGPLGKLATSIFGPLGGIVGKVLPVVGVITAIITAVQLVKSHLQEIRGFIQKTFGDGALAVFDKVVAVISNIGNTIRNVFSDGNIGAARDKIQEIFGGRGVKVFDTLVKTLSTVQGVVGNVVQFIADNVVPVAGQVLNVLVISVIPGIIEAIQAAAPIIMQIIQEIAGFIAQMVPVIGSFIAGLMPVISQIISFVQANVLPVVSSIFGFIVSTVLPAILVGVQQLSSVIITVLSAALPVVQTVFTTIWNVIQPIMQMILQVVQAVLPSVFSIFQSVFTAISGVVSAFQQVLSGIIQFISGVFSGNWSAAWNGVKAIFSGVWEAIKSIATGAIDAISSAVNGVIDGISKVKETIGGVGGKVAKVLHIPGFAGGTDRTPDTFIAGENGPELITNAPGMKVYTKEQTKRILDNMDKAKKLNAERGAGNNIIPFVTRFAKGTDRTPDTFLTGENGPELITRAANRSRFAAAQTGKRFNNMAQAGDLNTASNVNAGVTGAGTITIHVTNNHTVNVKGGETDGIKEQLQQYDEEFLEKIRQIIISILREQQEQEGRVAYA